MGNLAWFCGLLIWVVDVDCLCRGLRLECVCMGVVILTCSLLISDSEVCFAVD